jgi:fucose permease
MKDDLGWSEYEKGLVLVSRDLLLFHIAPLTFCVAFQSAFYWGYSLGQIPASWIIQRYGAKWIFGFRYSYFFALFL